MTISAKIIADSISEAGVRITTMQLRYPRFIHAEFMTHRAFSRNASSSRAIPVERMIKDVLDDTAMPVHWGRNQKGMQANGQLSAMERAVVIDEWYEARDKAIASVREMIAQGLHKQVVNRLLEPFSHINVLVTSTDWANFFALRDHKDAQPEIAVLARLMKEAMAASTPSNLPWGEWHLPYININDYQNAVDHLRNTMKLEPIGERIQSLLVKLSVARCASVSYMTVEGEPMTFERALAIYDKLLAGAANGDPIHASPAEHQATPDSYNRKAEMLARHGSWLLRNDYEQPHLHGNFTGWIQYRKTLAGECFADKHQ